MDLSSFCYAAYIGPGAGFAFVGYFLILLTTLLLVVGAILSWPVRALLAPLLRKRRPLPPKTKRVVLLGLDGLDPALTRRLIDEGRLPNLKHLAETGTFSELESTCPPISPVAWSSFSTGANPGKHNIFDFLNRDLATCQPMLSSAQVREGTGRFARPVVRGLRKSKSLWRVLSEYGIYSTVLRVPITFPAEKIKGRLLSAMCVPDLRGTQGTSTFFSTDPQDRNKGGGGLCVPVERDGDSIHARLPGPEITRGGRRVTLEADLRIRFPASARAGEVARLKIGRETVPLRFREFTPWVRVRFKVRPATSVYGMCQFYLRDAEPEFRLYATPINIDPERPALPISYPVYYAMYLARLQGPYATLGIAEDTWALNEGILDGDAFLKQAYSIHDEREAMFFNDLRLTRSGLCVCVFDTPDRIQHMFYRQHESGGRELEEMYEKMDDLVGRTRKKLRRNDVLMVLSDHGITSFKRGVNLNAWLRDHGYLKLKNGSPSASSLAGIDWSATRAYTFGLSGIYINRAGREARGIVAPEDTGALRKEIREGLRALVDPADGRHAVREAYDTADVYAGPYVNNGPDLVIGYAKDYRASWKSALGETEAEVFSDNEKQWSGDHCVDYRIVPGVLFSNWRMDPDASPRLIDIAPTVLDLFGIPTPKYMDGRPVAMARPEGETA